MNKLDQYKKGDIIAGKFTVYESLTGGMGQVYLCFDENKNPVALKTLQSHFSLDVDAQQSFKDEIRIWVSLDRHPNIVRCFGMQILDGYPFIIMEWVVGDEGRGVTLRDRLRAGPLSIQDAMDFIIDICRGLLHAQKKLPGIVHSDLKPENILIARGGTAKITDFGLASEGQVRSGVAGTPHYMAPEQWTDRPLDGRTDIYALGCIFFELLTGQTPFTSISANELRSQHFSSPIPLISNYQQVPQPLQGIVEHCMAKDLENRCQNVQDLLTDLENIYINLFNKQPKPLLENKKLTAHELVNKALAYYSIQRVDETLGTLDLAIQESDDFLLAYVVRSDVRAGLGNFSLALKDAERAIELNPLSALGYLARAVALLNFPNRDSYGLDDIEKALKLEPDNPSGYIVRSQFHIYLNEYEDALSDIQKAAQYIPNHWLVFMVRAQIYANLQYLDFAQKELQACRTQWQYIPLQNRAHILAVNAEIYNALGQCDLALQEINQALQGIQHYSFFLVRAKILSALHKNEDAFNDVNYAIKLSPTAIIYVWRAMIEIALMKPKDALEDLSVAIKKMPNLWLAHHYLAIVLLQMKKPDSALLEFEKVRNLINELPPDNLVQFEAYTGLAYVEKKEFALGKKHLNLAVAVASNFRPLIKAFAFLNRGLASIDMGLWHQASSDLQSALECDNNYSAAFFGFGVLSISRGEFENARPHFAQAIKLGLTIPFTYQVLVSDDREKIIKDILLRLLKIKTFSEFEKMRMQEPLLQDPVFMPTLQNIFSLAAKEADLSELPAREIQILEWMSLSNFGRLNER